MRLSRRLDIKRAVLAKKFTRNINSRVFGGQGLPCSSTMIRRNFLVSTLCHASTEVKVHRHHVTGDTGAHAPTRTTAPDTSALFTYAE